MKYGLKMKKVISMNHFRAFHGIFNSEFGRGNIKPAYLNSGIS
jgi:hypothetical protein